MRPALSSRSLRRPLSAGELALWDAPGEARVLGLDAVTLDGAVLTPVARRPRGLFRRLTEPPHTDLPERTYDPTLLDRIRQSLDYYHVTLAAWHCAAAYSPAGRSAGAIRLALTTARALGGGLVCVVLDDAALGGSPAPIIDGLGVLAVDAERLGVRLALEWAGGQPAVMALLGILQGVASSWLGLSLAPPAAGPQPPEEVVAQIAAQALHVELHLTGIGAAEMYRPWLGALRGAGYRGAVGLDAGAADDAEYVLREAAALVRRYA